MAIPVLLTPFYVALISPWQFIIFTVVAIPILFRLTKKNPIDRFIGDLSYNIYIIHLPVIILVGKSIDANYRLVAIIAIVTSLAIALHLIVDRPMDRYRHRLASVPTSEVNGGGRT